MRNNYKWILFLWLCLGAGNRVYAALEEGVDYPEELIPAEEEVMYTEPEEAPAEESDDYLDLRPEDIVYIEPQDPVTPESGEIIYTEPDEYIYHEPETFYDPYQRNASTYGIDVSKYQGVIDWERLGSYGPHPIKFMYAKASQGVTIRDDFYRRNMEEARRQGIMVGSYHYLSSGGTGIEQCDYFMETMEGVHQDLIPVVDVEEVHKRWGVVTLRRHLRDFVNRMEKVYGVKPMIYTGIFFYNLYLSEEFKDCKLFLARYSDLEPMTNDGTNWVVWQFTEQGEINGINHYVDIDCINSKNTLDDIMIIPQGHKHNPRSNIRAHVRPNAVPRDAGIH